MSILRKKSEPAAPEAAVVEQSPEPTVGKGAPTPKRRDQQGRKGPVAPPPQTQREAYRRAKTQSTPMSKEERKVASGQRRERMMRGDDAAVLPRDRGPVRRYVRDLVDTRRNLSGLLLPVLLVAFLGSLVSPVIQVYGFLIMLVVMLASFSDAFVAGRQIKRKLDARFPKGDPNGLSTKGFAIGYYAFNRAMLPRRWRAPRPRYRVGDTVE